jgi:tetratricopeptide (TPR) repeat protein
MMTHGVLLALLPWLLLGPFADQDETASRKEALKHYRAGQQALHAEAWDEAEREFKEAVHLDRLLTPAHYGLGQVYMATKRYPEAVKAYRDCRDAFHAEDSLQLMDNKAVEQRLQDQIQTLKQSVRQLQSGRMQTTNTAVTIQKLEDQIHDLERRRHRRGDQPLATPAAVSLALGSAYFRSGAIADAEREYGEAVRVDTKLGEAHNNLAVVYLLTGRIDEAEREVTLAERGGFPVSAQLKKDIASRREERVRK